MKKLLLILLVASSSAKAHQSKTITEDSPFVSDGIEYGYSIKKCQHKRSK